MHGRVRFGSVRSGSVMFGVVGFGMERFDREAYIRRRRAEEAAKPSQEELWAVFLDWNPDYPRLCKMKGCGKYNFAHGYCSKHVHHARRANLIPKAKKRANYRGVSCSIEGCGERARSLGMCYTHYARVKKYGDPNKVGKPGRPKKLGRAIM